MTTVKIILLLFLLSLFLNFPHPVFPGKKKCGVKVVAIEQIKYKAVPVEVVEETPKPKYSPSTHAPAPPYPSAPVPSVRDPYDPRYQVRQTTRTMDMTEIFDEMLNDYRARSASNRNKGGKAASPTPASPYTSAGPKSTTLSPTPHPPAIYIMPIPVPVTQQTTPTTTPPSTRSSYPRTTSNSPTQYGQRTVPPIEVSRGRYGPRRQPSIAPDNPIPQATMHPTQLPIFPLRGSVNGVEPVTTPSRGNVVGTPTVTSSLSNQNYGSNEYNGYEYEDDPELIEEVEEEKEVVREYDYPPRKRKRKSPHRAKKVHYHDHLQYEHDEENHNDNPNHYDNSHLGVRFGQSEREREQDAQAIRQVQSQLERGKNRVLGVVDNYPGMPVTFGDLLVGNAAVSSSDNSMENQSPEWE